MRTHVRYAGRVQGVGFRATTVSIARGRPITGWVRNEPDGSVLLNAQGHADAISDFLNQIASQLGHYITHESRSIIADRSDESGFTIQR